MVDLVVINPGGQHGIYGPLGETLTALEPPPWARMIAGYIRDRSFSVEIIDCEAEGYSPEEVVELVKYSNPKLIAIVVAGHQPSASTQAMTSAGNIALAIKSFMPSLKIIMTGNHPSALPLRTLKEETVDYVCDGEGPLTIYGLLRDFHLEDIPGLVWKDPHHSWARTGLAKPTEHLDKDLHGNVWDLLPMEKYRAHSWQCFGDLSKRTPYASIYTTLGCSFKCSFCCINAFQHSSSYRRFPPEFVVDQIINLHFRHGVETLKIADEMFILNENHYTEICQRLIKSGLGKRMNIWAYARIDTVKPPTLSLLREAGIQWLALGIESGSKHVRDGARKKLRTDDIVGIVKQIQAAGINVVGNFIFGLRDDTVETLTQTLMLAFECLPEFANFYSCMAYPGSDLYTQAVKEGWTLPNSWAGYSQHNRYCRPLDTEHIDAKTVLQFRDYAFKMYFSNLDYQFMIRQKFGSAALEHIKEMLTYELPRDLLNG